MADLPKSIVIVGRRWFDKANRNTYHTAQIFVDGEQVEGVGRKYGYGDQYYWSAFEKLQQLGIVPDWDRNQTPFTWCEKNGIKLSYTATDVSRKKDL